MHAKKYYFQIDVKFEFVVNNMNKIFGWYICPL